MSLVIPVAESIAHWLRDLCNGWVVAFLASIVVAVVAFGIQRDRRAEQSIKTESETDFSKMYDAMEKKNLSQADFEHWREVHRERCRAALSAAEASRWESACRFWILAAVCALAAVVMLYVKNGP